MIRDGSLFLSVVVLGAVLLSLVTPTGGFVFVAGDSMDPAIPSGCSVVSAHAWDGESSLEGEVVAFDSKHVETDVVGSSVLDAEPWVAHRVVAEYESYDATEADHYVTEDGYLVVESTEETRLIETNQGYDDAMALEGERVLVLKGDNNAEVDPVLVHEDEVLGVLEDREYVTIQDSGSWPCAALE